MLYVIAVLLLIAICMMGYMIYKSREETPAKKVEKEKQELIQREVKHYNHVFNYNVGKAYGGE